MTMARFVTISLLAGLYASYCGQNVADSTESLPDERGIIMTTNNNYYSYRGNPSILRHLPVYPGYENTDVYIQQLTLNNKMSRIQSVDVDYATKSIYMYDYYLGSIIMVAGYNKDLVRTNMTLADLYVVGSRGTIEVAVDWLSHTVYWTDTTFNWIIAAPGQMEKAKMDYYKVIVDDHLDSPNGITLDPNNASIFWIDIGTHPKIERSDMMGGNRHTIITSKGGVLKSPMSIEADVVQKRIYWLDSRTDAVMTAKYDGSDVNVIQRLVHTMLTEMAIFRDCVVVVDRWSNNMYTLNKTLGPRKGMTESPAVHFYQYEVDGLAVYSPETQPQRDTDFCALKMCEQMCLTTVTGANCVCADRYEMNNPTGNCTEVYNKVIVYANATHICLVDIRAFARKNYTPACIFTLISDTTRRTNFTTTSSPTASSDDRITMFDMNMEERMLYFVSADNTIYERDMDLPITNDVKIVIVRASGNVSGLAYDALDTNNLYWCESDTGAVMVVNVQTLSPNVISTANSTFTNPSNLIVLLRQRKLAWIAGTTHTDILTMTMDGEDFSVVYKHTTNVSSLTADEHKKLFYFLSGGSIYSVMFNGSNVTSVRSADATAYKLLFYNGYMAWIYTTPNNNDMMKSVVGSRVNTIGNLDNVSTIVDIKVLDTKLQSTHITSPCAYENGNCSQICISKYQGGAMTMVCECKLGFTLDNDLSSCKTDLVNDNFIIVSDLTNDALLQIDLETDHISAIPNIEEATGVYFDSVTNRLIWSEYWSTQIYSSYLNGSDRQILAELGNARPQKFDMDMTTGNLYYTGYGAHIGMVTRSGIQLTVLSKNNTYWWSFIGDVVVHPGKGWMFYTQYDWTTEAIIRSNMDGTNVSKLIEGSHVNYPDSLAIDFKNDNLYWSDEQHDTIQRCDLDGLNCSTVINITDASQEIRDLVIDGHYLYYTAYKFHHIVRVELQKPHNITIVGQHAGLGRLDTITLHNSSNTNVQSVAYGCKDRNGLGDCSSICIPTPTGRKCACEEGVCLMWDQRTCSNAHLCDPIITQTSVTFEKEEIFIEGSCYRRLNDECKYKCTGNSVPVKKQLTCTPVGWDFEFETLCKESICDNSTLSNGHVQAPCGMKIGEACPYQCDKDYTNTTYKAVCAKELSWYPRNSCTKSICDDSTLSNGHVKAPCGGKIGETCLYQCDKDYTNTTYNAVCAKDLSWYPRNSCTKSTCDNTALSNGHVQATCGRKIGEACPYQCDKDYTNTTYKAVCTKDLSWLPWNACTKSMCDDSTLSHGHVQATCGRKIGEACLYQCDKDYTNTTYMTMCMKDHSWLPWNACTKHLVPQRQTDDEGPETGLVIGIAILTLVLIALVAGLAFFIRRNINTSTPFKHGIAFYSRKHANTAIETPRDEQNRLPEDVKDTKDEQPDRMPFANAGASSADDGFMHSMYTDAQRDEEPWEETHDNVILTNDSWFKEIQKNKKNKNKF